MAILKHIASKNANYGSAIDYLKYQHDEFHLVPILDENGNMMLRDEFYLEGLNCDPETFDLECELLNQEYNKNNTYDEIKSHHPLHRHLLRNLPILPNWCRPFCPHPLMSARCQVLDNIFHKFLF